MRREAWLLGRPWNGRSLGHQSPLFELCAGSMLMSADDGCIHAEPFEVGVLVQCIEDIGEDTPRHPIIIALLDRSSSTIALGQVTLFAA